MEQSLGGLLTHLCVLAVMPDERRLAEYLIEVLPRLPEIAEVGIQFRDPPFRLGEPCTDCPRPLGGSESACHSCPWVHDGHHELFPLKTAEFHFGHVLVRISDGERFRAFRPHLSNSFILVSSQLENIRYRRHLLETNEEMEGALTTTRRSVEALRNSETRHREMIANISDVITLLDRSGRITYASPNLERWFGWRPEEVVGSVGWSLVHPEDRERVRADQDSFFARDGGILTREFRFQCQDGTYREIELTATNLFGDPIIGGALMNFRDITERRKIEAEKHRLTQQIQQTQKLESLGILAGGIAHDFNNIIMAMLGHAELALDELSPVSNARGDLNQIVIAARRAAELCRQMLAYSGKASFALERLSLCELIEEMAHLLKTSISKKAVLNLNLEKDLPPILADPSQIRQIVLNLLINASDAIGDRSGVITLVAGATRCDEEYLRQTELYESLVPGTYVHLEVADTGCGMDLAARQRIFEPFFTTKFTGRGLGLAAVLGIVRAHKGAIKVYSEPGKGTTFKILFPALEGSPVAAVEEISPHFSWRGHGTILLADDEESLQALGARILEKMGFTVLIAASGREAVEIYRRQGRDVTLVILDLTMPHMDGAEAFGELRRLNPDIRVVIASGYSEEDVVSRFAGKGLAGVLQKPFSLGKLRHLLRSLLSV